MMIHRKKLEVCTATLEDCLTAERGGADRLELNTALELGGLTPSVGLQRRVCGSVSIPVIVMIRPRPGGFCYSSQEFELMRADAELALREGADGLAFGFLTEDRRIDVERTAGFVTMCSGTEAVFHRAFDLAVDPFEAVDQLVEAGVRRVLTSGQKATALEGADTIRRLIERAAGRLEILPGSGIRAGNVLDLMARTGCEQVHASLSRFVADHTLDDEGGIDFGGPRAGGKQGYRITDIDQVRAVRTRLDHSQE